MIAAQWGSNNSSIKTIFFAEAPSQSLHGKDTWQLTLKEMHAGGSKEPWTTLFFYMPFSRLCVHTHTHAHPGIRFTMD